MSIPDRFIPDGEIRIEGDESLPEIGDRVAQPWGDSLIVGEVVDVPGTTAGEYDLGDTDLTLAQAMHCPEDDPVVEFRHVREDDDTVYYAPLSQLEYPVDDTEADA